jgi:hypothetical protein
MRLTKRDSAGNALKNCEDCKIKFRESCCSKQLCLNALINKLAAYEDAEEQGRLVILPCKIGDKVFRVVPKCSRSYIQCPFNGGYGIDRCNNCDAFIQEESFYLSMFENIGKTIFLTYEEAKAAMGKGQDDV